MSPLHDASRAGDTELVKQLLDDGAPVDEKDEHGNTALMVASGHGNTEVVKLLLEKGASFEKKDVHGGTALMDAVRSRSSRRMEVVQLLLDQGASGNEKDEYGKTALMMAIEEGDTQLMRLLLDKGASIDLKGNTWLSEQLQQAISNAQTELMHLLLEQGAAFDDKTKPIALQALAQFDEGQLGRMAAALVGRHSMKGQEEEEALAEAEAEAKAAAAEAYSAHEQSLAEVVAQKIVSLEMTVGPDGVVSLKMLVLRGTEPRGKAKAEKAWSSVEGRWHAARKARAEAALTKAETAAKPATEAARRVKEKKETKEGRKAVAKAAAAAAAVAVLQLVRLAGFARDRAREKRSSDPRSADDHEVLFRRLQLAAAACLQSVVPPQEDDRYASQETRDSARDEFVQELLSSKAGKQALEHAVKLEAKELLAQPVVQAYINFAWRGVIDMNDADLVNTPLVERGLIYAFLFVVLLLQLLFLLPLVALVPALQPWLTDKLEQFYFLRLPVIKFGLECAADLALALAFTLIPATGLATVPFAPLLLVWVGSGLLWEAFQIMASSSDSTTRLAQKDIDEDYYEYMWFYKLEHAMSALSSRLAPWYYRVAAYWSDSINRVDATALVFSFAALVALVSSNDPKDPSATSLRAAAVFLLWFRVIRVLLISSEFGPFVLMFFRMLFGDLLRFLVLLFFLLVAFTASWTVLLEAMSPFETAGCAEELGGVHAGITNATMFTTLVTLLEGALTASNHFECARSSTTSPVATWSVSFVFVILTTVLLLNMLIAMMAKTFDNISEASATNYLFLFAQRTLALQDEPPTPPPLNALGLPCQAICWGLARLRPEEAAANKYLLIYLESIGAMGKAVEKAVEKAAKAAEGKVTEENKAAQAAMAAKAAVAEEDLRTAAENGDLETLTRLVEEGTHLDATNMVGRTALMLAAYYGKLGCLDHLIVKGANLNAQDEDKWTALYLAAKSKTTGGFRRAAQDPRGHASCVESLLKAGADTSLKTDDNETALDTAKEYSHTEVIELLEKYDLAAQAAVPFSSQLSSLPPSPPPFDEVHSFTTFFAATLSFARPVNAEKLEEGLETAAEQLKEAAVLKAAAASTAASKARKEVSTQMPAIEDTAVPKASAALGSVEADAAAAEATAKAEATAEAEQAKAEATRAEAELQANYKADASKAEAQAQAQAEALRAEAEAIVEAMAEAEEAEAMAEAMAEAEAAAEVAVEVAKAHVAAAEARVAARLQAEAVAKAEAEAVTLQNLEKPLAKQIKEYILDHQDDAAQEARWRTTMKRDMTKSFRKVKEELTNVEAKVDEVHSKMDEKLDRIAKDLAILARQAAIKEL